MAVKVFCNMCQQFIRDAKPAEISNLKGTEICKSCESKTVEIIASLQKMSGRAAKQITDVASKAIAEMDEMKRRVIEGEGSNDGKDTQKLG